MYSYVYASVKTVTPKVSYLVTAEAAEAAASAWEVTDATEAWVFVSISSFANCSPRSNVLFLVGGKTEVQCVKESQHVIHNQSRIPAINGTIFEARF